MRRRISDTDLLAVCIEAVRAAGGHARANRRRRRETVEVALHDVKLALDVESQAAAAAVIRRRYPTHALLGEERGLDESGEYRWVIDPIDGTVNFAHGLPYWASSVAVQVEGRTVAGAIWLPDLDELYTVTSEGPACCNETPICVSNETDLSRSIVYTGMVEEEGDRGVSLRVAQRLASAVRKLRILGSAAAELCYVAAGKGEAYVETSIHLWDVAAGALLVERAGGRCEVLEDLGNHTMRFLATNHHTHESVRALIRSAIEGPCERT